MGNCVAASRRHDSGLKIDWSDDPKAGDQAPVLVELPVKGSEGGIRSSGFELNSKEEMFFDSQPWLESDCEDYFSVCDETPSYGNSPVHPKKLREQPLPVKSLSTEAAVDSVTEPPVTELKKQLHELFQESFRANQVENKLGDIELPPNSPSNSPYSPIVISDQAPGSVKKAKSAQSPQCCIPSLVRSLSFGERKKRMKPANGTVVQSSVMEGKA
ncbi:uncharacterized protein At3g27210-like [Punica granatum]|uniref:Uncharacterized protein n=2 Tax=Punica granatum TaxID=22663 RepID=A0A2I0LCB6_PUNGR|nr:uncharacterized protein At3g27210-like [Punica granatum]PKI78325.1 hypothetical protein CRG98_001268 [Punica granatum]